MTEIDNGNTLLEVSNLKVHFPVMSGILRRTDNSIRAVDGVSFKIDRGSTVGLVGESGSGKTTIGRAIVKLAPISNPCFLQDHQSCQKTLD